MHKLLVYYMDGPQHQDYTTFQCESREEAVNQAQKIVRNGFWRYDELISPASIIKVVLKSRGE